MPTTQSRIVLIILGLIGILVGFLLVSIFAGPIIDNFATSGENANLPSFSGGKSFNDIFPLFYYIHAILLIIGSAFTAGIGVRGLVRPQ